MAGGKHILGKQNAPKVFGTAKVGDRGQIVIPKEAREVFELKPGDSLLVLGDISRGLALVKTKVFDDVVGEVFNNM